MAHRYAPIAALAWIFSATPAVAQEPAARPPPCASRRAETRVPEPLPAVIAVVPGALVHGAGHFAKGRDDTALTLLWLEGVGVGGVLLSGTVLVLTGASRYLVAPAALAAIGGVGLFTTTFLADVYGAIAPPCGFGAPPDTVPYLEAEAGHRYVYDRQFAYRNFGVVGAVARFGRWRLAPSGWFALDDHNERLRLEAGLRVLGPLPREHTRRGTFLAIDAAATHHDFDTEGFARTTAELTTGGRLDLEAIGPTLSGSFSEASAGAAVATTGFDGGVESDIDWLLLARFAFGVYLGEGRGEAALFYDHRHDGFAAGSIVPGLGSGVVGHFGMSGVYYFAEDLGLAAEGMVGAAYVGGLSLRFRQR